MDVTVLLVDDDNEIRDVLKRALQAEGLRVLPVADGQAALDVLRREGNGVHLVITDLKMPRFNGFQLAEWMGVWDYHQPIIFMTGYEHPGVRLSGPLIYKPFSSDELLAEVRKVLRQIGISPIGLARQVALPFRTHRRLRR